jgi:putative FmdB family regulatory protein
MASSPPKRLEPKQFGSTDWNEDSTKSMLGSNAILGSMAKLSTTRTYEYECKKCRERETLRRTVDQRDDEVTCKKCDTQMMRKFSLGHFTI